MQSAAVFQRCLTPASGCRREPASSSRFGLAATSWSRNGSSPSTPSAFRMCALRSAVVVAQPLEYVEAVLHIVQHLLVFPTRDSPVIARCASRLDRTSGTRGSPVSVQRETVLNQIG